ncbi:Uncharacterised protein [Yersinia intermedia]|nr:Uncharacterised protein [Yersinia intermedia]
MMNAKAKRDITHKTKVLNYVNNTQNVAKTCRQRPLVVTIEAILRAPAEPLLS